MIACSIIITMLAVISAGILWTDTSYSEGLKIKATNGDMDAQFNLGLCYQTGSGIEKDMESAHYWFTKAAVQGHAESVFILNTLFKNT